MSFTNSGQNLAGNVGGIRKTWRAEWSDRKRAEEVFAGLSAPAQQAFPRVLAALVTVEASATSCPASRKELGTDSGRKKLLLRLPRRVCS